MKKYEQHPQSDAKAHSKHSHKPIGRVMPSMRDAKNDAGDLDFGAIASSIQQGGYTPDAVDGNDGTSMTADQVRAAGVLGVTAQEGWDWVIIVGKRHH